MPDNNSASTVISMIFVTVWSISKMLVPDSFNICRAMKAERANSAITRKLPALRRSHRVLSEVLWLPR